MASTKEVIMCINPYHETFLDVPTRAWKVIWKYSSTLWSSGPCYGTRVIPDEWMHAGIAGLREAPYGFCVMPRANDIKALYAIYNNKNLYKIIPCMVKGKLRIGYEDDHREKYSRPIRTAWAAEWIRFRQKDLDELGG